MQDIFLSRVAVPAIIVIFLGSATFLFLKSLDKTERQECLQWQQDASAYDGFFFLSSWQEAQCKAHGITIDAPVK